MGSLFSPPTISSPPPPPPPPPAATPPTMANQAVNQAGANQRAKAAAASGAGFADTLKTGAQGVGQSDLNTTSKTLTGQ